MLEQHKWPILAHQHFNPDAFTRAVFVNEILYAEPWVLDKSLLQLLDPLKTTHFERAGYPMAFVAGFRDDREGQAPPMVCQRLDGADADRFWSRHLTVLCTVQRLRLVQHSMDHSRRWAGDMEQPGQLRIVVGHESQGNVARRDQVIVMMRLDVIEEDLPTERRLAPRIRQRNEPANRIGMYRRSIGGQARHIHQNTP